MFKGVSGCIPTVSVLYFGSFNPFHYCPLPLPFHSPFFQDLKIRPETFKQLQEVVGSTLEHKGIGNNFLNRTQKAQHLRERMNTWNCIKLKSFCTAKETVTRLKRLLTEWEKILPATHPVRD
jgi:hypothetical protein